MGQVGRRTRDTISEIEARPQLCCGLLPFRSCRMTKEAERQDHAANDAEPRNRLGSTIA